MDKKIIRIIPNGAADFFPLQDSRLTVEHLCIGQEKNYYSYTNPVSTNAAGHVSGGGTGTGAYLSFDFGFAVVNVSDVSMRVQFSFAEVDRDGYTVTDKYIWDDIAPGEKRRLWANFYVLEEETFKFAQYVIKQIAIGPTPAEGKKGFATWSATTHPNKSLFEIFDLGKKPLPRSKSFATGCLGSVVAIAVLLFFVAACRLIFF